MDHCDGHDHVGKNTERREPRQESEDEPHAAKEFGGDGQERQYRWDVHDAGQNGRLLDRQNWREECRDFVNAGWNKLARDAGTTSVVKIGDNRSGVTRIQS